MPPDRSTLPRPSESIIPFINLDRSSRISLQKQIYLEIARAIRTGSLPQEARLPASRTLARLLGVSRNTVVTAYEDLAAGDLIRAKRGSGMRVNGRSLRVISSTGISSPWMRDILRSANYPERVLVITDPDGNPLYLNS